MIRIYKNSTLGFKFIIIKNHFIYQNVHYDMYNSTFLPLFGKTNGKSML